MDDSYPAELRALLRRAFARMNRRLRDGAPTLSVHALAWVRSLSGGGPPETYFMHQRAFPMLLLPWWLESAVRRGPARRFHGDVVYSTVAGYYFVRMIDDLMDREIPPEPSVLPAMIFFHTEFQLTYQRWFAQGHPFWSALTAASLTAADTASRDAQLAAIDREQFVTVSARKIAGAKIPIAAVCHRYERPDLLRPWSRFVDLLGCWHQMRNDIQGWSRDLERGRRTYFLSEASSRADASASVAEWVIDEGLAWGFAELDGWMDEVLRLGRQLGSGPLVAYLERRRADLVLEREGLASSAGTLKHLASVLR
jgi:hypothetical protein